MSSSRLISHESSRPQAESLSTLLWSSLFIAGLFAAVSLVASPIPGVNEPHYLAKARAFEDPTWCSRDFFLTSRNAHYCFFWLTGFLTRFLSLDAIAMMGRLTSAVLLAVGWDMLGRSLQLTAVFRLIAAGLFASFSLAGSFSGEWLLGGFESKVPAWGFCFMTISLWIRGQQRTCPGWMTAAGLLCGVGCSLHPVVGGWVAACVCLASCVLLVRTRTRLLKSIAGLLGFGFTTLVVSLPGLIPALRLVMDKRIPQKDRELASFYQVFRRLKHHLDPTELTRSQWIYAGVVVTGIVLSAMWLWWSGRNRAAQLSADETLPAERSRALACLLTLFAISGLIAIAGVLIGWHTQAAQEMNGWEWRAALLKFYPFRCFDALLPVTLALLVSRILQDICHRLSSASLTNAPQSSETRSWPVIGSRCCGGTVFSAALLVFAVVVPVLQAWRTRESAPAGYTAAQFADWRAACDWIRLNTSNDSLFLTPRESFGFKWFSERAEFVCYKDCPQDAAGILTWNKRLWMLHDWTLKSSSDLRYDEADLRTLRKQTDCDFIVTRILGPFESKPLWEGREWKIYAVR